MGRSGPGSTFCLTKSGQGSGTTVPLTEKVACIGVKSCVTIDPAGWPVNLDLFDSRTGTEPEVKPGIGGGKIRSAADAPTRLGATAFEDGHAGADGVTVGLRAGELNGEKMARFPGRVAQQDERCVLSDQYQVDVPIVVQVATGQSPSNP